LTQPAQTQGFEDLLDYLARTRGFDFGAYKRSSLMRRINKRIQMVGLDNYPDYTDYLEVHPEEFGQLFNTVLINVTGFFRDAPSWEYLKQEVVPRMLADKRPAEQIRLWSAGCASGEEAYSLAMLLAEALDPEAYRQRVKVYATDIDEEALAQARQASYAPQRVESVPSDLLAKYFDAASGRYVFKKDVRRAVIFGRHDLLQDAPISRVDLLVCRNTLMYFNAEAQTRILSRFEFALNSGGFLFLGKAEVMLSRLSALAALDLKRRIFVKTIKSRPRDRQNLAALRTESGGDDTSADTTRLRTAAMEADPTAQIVADASGTLVLANDAARVLLGITAADVGHPLADLEFIRNATNLHDPIELVYTERRSRTIKDVEWPAVTVERRYVDVTLMPLFNDTGVALGVKIVFNDVTRLKRLQEELQQSHQELETANEELQSANEELETTNEELQSTVEELETTNEELQSTNEELETMNEELQSTNEELETTNEELQRRSDELNSLNGLLGSILGSLNDGVIVVDHNMHILAWNGRSEDLWGLRSDEVMGKHLMGLDIGLPVEQLKQTIRTCLGGNPIAEGLVLNAINRRGKVIRVRVNCACLDGQGQDSRGAIVLVDELRETG
jgi:two-component system, chemotaxis family, CheB/CheR fusion protein